jgi:transposase InsO family protein
MDTTQARKLKDMERESLQLKRLVTAMLRSESRLVNHQRVERIWRQEGLKVPQEQLKRGRLWLNEGFYMRLRPYPATMYRELQSRKLRDELLNGEIFYTLREAKILIEHWRREYNQVRPHSAFG